MARNCGAILIDEVLIFEYKKNVHTEKGNMFTWILGASNEADRKMIEMLGSDWVKCVLRFTENEALSATEIVNRITSESGGMITLGWGEVAPALGEMVSLGLITREAGGPEGVAMRDEGRVTFFRATSLGTQVLEVYSASVSRVISVPP